MRTSLATLLLIATIAFPCVHAQAQSQKTANVLRLDDPSDRPPATIDEMSWLVGFWAGEGLGGHVEETWNAPSGGTMVGTFKLLHGGEPTMYEIEWIAEEEGSLVWIVKHFGADFSAWEEKAEYVSFPLVRVEPGEAYFDGLTVRKEGEDKLRVFVVMSSEEGLEEASFVFERVK